MWAYQWRLLLNRNGHVIKSRMETEMKRLWVVFIRTLQLLLYWLTLKDGSEGWLVEPGTYYIRPHTTIQPKQTIKIL